MISNSLSHAPFDPRSHDLDPGPQEKSLKSFCVSFGKDCTLESYFADLLYRANAVL